MPSAVDPIHAASHTSRVPVERRQRSGTDLALLGVLLAVAFAVAYAPVISTLKGQWETNDTYSFGVLVPFISGYLVWTRRSRLMSLPITPCLWTGGAVVLAAGALLVLGRVSAIVAFQELSLVVMLFGLVLLIAGRRVLREVWFPLSYLLLMLPMWEILTDRLHYGSQLFSARLGEQLLHLAGVPVHRDQVYLELPNITLEVASACSGVNFLIAVIAVGVPQAYLFLRGWIPRALVIAFAVTIAFLSNGVRVATIGVLAYHQWSAAVHGPGHMLQGLFVSSFGFLALLAGIGLLSRRYPRLPDRQVPDASPAAWRSADRTRLFGATVAAALVLVGVAVFRPEYSVLAAAADNDRLPVIGTSWRELPPVSARFVTRTTAVPPDARVFQAPSGERIELFVGSMAQRSPTGGVMYRAIELPTGVNSSQVLLSEPSSTGNGVDTLRVNRAVFFSGGHETHVIFWYDVNGRATAQAAAAKAYASAQLLVGQTSLPRFIVAVMERPAGDRSQPEIFTRFVLDASRALGDTPDGP